MSKDFLDYLHELFSEFGAIRTRAMFGGHGVYFEDRIIGIVIDDEIYLKVDDLTRAAFEAEGCAPFLYDAGDKQIAMSYWSVPAEAMDSPQALLPWARRANEAALRKPIGRRKAKKK